MPLAQYYPHSRRNQAISLIGAGQARVPLFTSTEGLCRPTPVTESVITVGRLDCAFGMSKLYNRMQLEKPKRRVPLDWPRPWVT